MVDPTSAQDEVESLESSSFFPAGIDDEDEHAKSVADVFLQPTVYGLQPREVGHNTRNSLPTRYTVIYSRMLARILQV